MEATLIVDCGRQATKYSLMSKKNKWGSEVQVESTPYHNLSKSPITEVDWLKAIPPLIDKALGAEDNLNIVFLLNTLCPRRTKESLLVAAFETYGARKVCLEYTAPAALFSCGETSGMAVDVGYTGVRITPVLHGVPVVATSSQFDDVGAFYAEMELLSHLQTSSPKMEWGPLLPQVMQLLDSEEADSDQKNPEIILPDGTTLHVPVAQSALNRAAEKLLFSSSTNVLDASWYALLNSSDTEANSHYLRCGGASESSFVLSNLASSLSRSPMPSPPSEVLSKNTLKAAAVGGSIFSQLSCFKSMCLTSEDYADEGPHSCVRQYATDSR